MYMVFNKKYPHLYKKHRNNRSNKSIPKLTFPYQTFWEKKVPQYVKYTCISTTQPILLPKRFVAYFRKMLRKWIKKRKIRVFINLCLNRTITTKAKNARMGKGSGTVNRFGFFCKAHHPIFVFKNISLKRAKYLVRHLNARMPADFYVYEV